MKLYQLTEIDEDTSDKVRAIIKFLEPSDTLNGWKFPGIWSSSYRTYLLIKTAFQKGGDEWTLKIIQAAFNLTPTQQMMCDVFQYYAAVKFIEQDFQQIIEKEKFLESKKDPLLIASGIDRLNKYGDTLTVDSLARTYGVTWDEVGKWKYSKVYTILAMEKERGEIMEKYNRLKFEK